MNAKLFHVLLLALAFFVVSNPAVYKVTDSVLGRVVGPLAYAGCPTTIGLLVHSLVFALVAYKLHL
jgi:hypothetical protein